MLRIVSAAVLLTILAAGCGSVAGRQRSSTRGVPRALARTWEARALAVADAARAGNNCAALRLATSLREDIAARASQLPRRLQSPLLTGASALADRITCTPPPRTVTVAPPHPKQPKPGPKPPKPGPKAPKPPKHGPPGDHGHGHGGDG
ncbi:MAG TPA: hypothetical protein VE985_08085 [Gaiellaceae bacterium]|nr:hypothetical protein [Gaiellaceae bacterium]